MPKRNPTGIDANTLKTILANGGDSTMLRARLAFIDAEQFRKALAKVAGKSFVHPTMLPTQASGRWSTTDPPVVNFPTDAKAEKKGLPPLRAIFVPHPGRYWLGWDWDAIEGRHLAAYSGDEPDIEAFNKGWDLHTLTACDVFKLPRPPKVTKAIHTCQCSDCTAWRKQVSWQGGEDLRRKLAKTGRYSLGYGGDPTDPYNLHKAAPAILNSPDISEFYSSGIYDKQLIDFGVKYLEAKRDTLVEWKAQTWKACMQTRVARTALGRRRMLFGSPESMAREGLNHQIQGLVADQMNLVLAKLVSRNGTFWGIAWLAYQSHDGAKISFPEHIPPREAYEACKSIVEHDLEINGRVMHYSASWEVTWPDGRKERMT